MGSINFNVDSVSMDEVLDKLDIEGKLGRSVNKALQAGADIVLQQAQANAPVRTGELKGSLKVGKRKRNRGTYSVEVGTFYPDAPHAHLVERGHGGPKPAPPHPFLEPAVESRQAEVTAAIMEELKKCLQ